MFLKSKVKLTDSDSHFPQFKAPFLVQGYLVWQLFLSAVFLRRRYAPGQLLGVVVSLAGITTVLAK